MAAHFSHDAKTLCRLLSPSWKPTLLISADTKDCAYFLAEPQNLANDGGYQVYGRSYLFDVGVRF